MAPCLAARASASVDLPTAIRPQSGAGGLWASDASLCRTLMMPLATQRSKRGRRAAPELVGRTQGHSQVEGPNTGPVHGSLPGPNTGHDAWAVATSPHDSSTANMAFFMDNLLVND